MHTATHRGAYGTEGGGGMYRSKMAGFSFLAGESTGFLGARAVCGQGGFCDWRKDKQK